MLKLTIAAVVSVAALTIAPLPVLTGTANAQQLRCTFAGPNCPSQGTTSSYNCTDQLGYLRRVYEDELEVVNDPLDVSIMPICMNEDVGIFRTEGNAGALRGVIADNEAMMEALLDAAFRPDEVVGVRMTGYDEVILYVHPFHHRSN